MNGTLRLASTFAPFAILAVAACAPPAGREPAVVVAPVGGAPAADPPSPSRDGVEANADTGPADPGDRVKLVAKKGPDGFAVCEVVEEGTGHVIGRATAHDTAAGGSEVECKSIAAGGRVVVLENSRGTYAKDARPGPLQDTPLPCGAAAFAPDVTSCVSLDTSPMVHGDFDVELCEVGKDRCKRLVTVPGGADRDRSKPRPWDAAYCSADRVAVVARGQLVVHEAPSGRALARAKAPGATRVSCERGVAEATGEGVAPTSLRLDGR